MAKKFLHIEDNEDGTSTMTVSLGESTDTYILELSFDDMASMFPIGITTEVIDGIEEMGVTHIPNDLEN